MYIGLTPNPLLLYVLYHIAYQGNSRCFDFDVVMKSISPGSRDQNNLLYVLYPIVYQGNSRCLTSTSLRRVTAPEAETEMIYYAYYTI